MSLRPRRGAHADGEPARRGVEGDVRRLPPQPGRAGRIGVRAVRPRYGTTTSTSTASCATTVCARSSHHAGSICPRANRATRPTSTPSSASATGRTSSSSRSSVSRGVETYPGSVLYVRAARDAGLHRGVVSASKNCRDILVSAGMDDLFEEVIDGVVAEREHLRGKPSPDTFLAGAAGPGCPAGRGGDLRGRTRRCRGRPSRTLRLRRRREPVRPGRSSARQGRPRRGLRPGRAARGRVTSPRTFEVEPWSVREASLDLDALAQTESVFALANGHIGLRANLDEGEPFGLPGTYLNSFYELRPLPYAEAGFGYPESGQTIVNVTNGKIIRLLVDDEPFDVRYGRAARARARARSPVGSASPPRGVGLTRRRNGPCAVDPARLVRPADDCGHPLRGRAGGRPAAGRRPVRAGRERACASSVARPSSRSGARVAAPLGGVLAQRRESRARSLDEAQWTARRGRNGSRRRRPRRNGHELRERVATWVE